MDFELAFTGTSIPNLALFFDNLEKNWKEADFN